ncbi:4Fe-4S ferredoxin [Thermincola ferriacetica]|uniref:4Fe-4S ferredoxin n=1 Tax=Thermincola ferriacetica TaxID=281456 RepID=A0A0L6W261_9FIRM|nr:4Fe-4S binding protein [Thermincola ferriacetica]KNZ69551.1 4Fe-4S ferredoxin [Thermincola ferriacetica]
MNNQIIVSTEKTEKIRIRPAVLTKFVTNITFRAVCQFFIIGVMIYAGWNFYGFYEYLRGNGEILAPYRPPVVEAFLPFAAVVASKVMFVTGEIDSVHPAGLVIFIAILLTAWIFRRGFCSWICPIGTLSEYLGKLGQKVMGRNLMMPKWLDILLLVLKYVTLLVILKLLLFLPTTEAEIFMQTPFYKISDIKMLEFYLNIGLVGILVIIILMSLSFLFKTFWCRYLCPYGALLGIIGIFSPVVLKKNNNSCIKCNKCNQVCPNKVNIKEKNQIVISTECIGCTSCVSTCPQPDTLKFTAFGQLQVSPLVYSVGVLAVFFGVIVIGMLTGHWESSLDISDFKSLYQQMLGGF